MAGWLGRKGVGNNDVHGIVPRVLQIITEMKWQKIRRRRRASKERKSTLLLLRHGLCSWQLS